MSLKENAKLKFKNKMFIIKTCKLQGSTVKVFGKEFEDVNKEMEVGQINLIST